MARSRTKYFLVRMTPIEKSSLNERARRAGLSVAHYVRCKVFDIPFEVVLQTIGKRPPKEASNAKSTTP